MRIEKSQNVNFKANLTGKTNLLRQSKELLEKHLGDDILLSISKPRSGEGAVIAIAHTAKAHETALGKLSFDLQTLIKNPTKVLENVKQTISKANKK